MCLAADGGSGKPPGSTNRTTILGGGLGSGGEFSGSFGDSGGGRGFGPGPGVTPPAARSSTLLTPAPSPGFDELDIGAGPLAGSKPEASGFPPPDFGELDIGGPPSAVPAFAPPLDAVDFTSPKLPKPKPISNSALPPSALGTDLSPPPLGTLLDSKISPLIPSGLPSVASKPAVHPGPGLGKTGTPPPHAVAPQGAPARATGTFGRSEKPKAPAPGFSFPGEEAAATRAAVLRPAVQGGNEGLRPSRTEPVVSPELDKLLLTGGASSPVGEFLNVTGSLSGLLPGTQSFERAQRRLAELEKGFSQAERKEVVEKLLDRASSRNGGLTDPFQGRSTGELRAPSFRSEFVENNLLGQLTLKPLGETVAGLKALAGQDPVNPFSGRILSPGEVQDSQVLALTSAATGGLVKIFKSFGHKFMKLTGGFSESDLLDRGMSPIRPGDRLTELGRSLAKHDGRRNSKFEVPDGSPKMVSRRAAEIAEEIIFHPKAEITQRQHTRYGDTIHIWEKGSEGRGILFGKDGEFVGFRNPKDK